MSFLFSARQVCEQVLRKIGSYSINDMGADGVELAVALDWLDLNMAQLAGTKELWFLVKGTASIPLTAAQATYDLSDILATDSQFPMFAQVETGSNTGRIPLAIVTRQQFEEIPNPTDAGDPDRIHIDRTTVPTMRVYPVPSLTGRTIKLTYQTFAPDLADKVGGNVAHGLSAAWQRWAILQVSSDVGDGPIRRLQDSKLARWVAEAEAAKLDLLGFENREHHDNPPISESSDIV